MLSYKYFSIELFFSFSNKNEVFFKFNNAFRTSTKFPKLVTAVTWHKDSTFQGATWRRDENHSSHAKVKGSNLSSHILRSEGKKK